MGTSEGSCASFHLTSCRHLVEVAENCCSFQAIRFSWIQKLPATTSADVNLWDPMGSHPFPIQEPWTKSAAYIAPNSTTVSDKNANMYSTPCTASEMAGEKAVTLKNESQLNCNTYGLDFQMSYCGIWKIRRHKNIYTFMAWMPDASLTRRTGAYAHSIGRRDLCAPGPADNPHKKNMSLIWVNRYRVLGFNNFFSKCVQKHFNNFL